MSRHIKSRSGCRVCKAKRLKCDEAVPACRNCINRGITCPGYRQVLRWSTKYEHPTAKAKAAKGESLLGFSSGPSSAGSSSDNTLAQFSELASAVTQSIKPDEPPSASMSHMSHMSQQAHSSSSSSASPATIAMVSPQPSLVKEEHITPGRPLSQVPPIPLSPHGSVYGSIHSHSSPMSASPINAHTPYMPSSTSPYMVPSPSVISISLFSDPTEISIDRDDWQTATYGDVGFDLGSIFSSGAIGITQSHNQGHDHGRDHEHRNENSESDGDFTLAPWQPERMMDMRMRHQQRQRQRNLAPSPPRTLTLASTSLVELWFKSVCGMWAAMDSPSNPFRRLCSNLWSSNEAVFFSMQTMAAASLPKRPPNISEIVMLAPQMSTQALINELQDLFTDKGGVQKKEFRFPSGLLTSLFCMSSSLSWIDARQLGIQYLRNARSVIDLIDLRADQLSADDRELLEFFRGCLLYEEMVRSVVTDDQEDIQALLDWQPPSLHGGGDKSKDKVSLSLHAWAGVPIVLVGLFGKVMALCRRSRKRWRLATTTRATYQLLYQSMLDIQEGQSLEQMLLSISIPSVVGGGGGDGNSQGTCVVDESSQDGFLSSPPASPELKSDIYNAAEAFRLLSLMQLYQTFPDLLSTQQENQTPNPNQLQNQQEQQVVELLCGQANQNVHQLPDSRDSGKFGDNASGILGSNGSMMPMALRTVWLLEAISPDSPMRCLQPLLVICAGSALRLNGDSDSGMPALTSSSPAFMIEAAPGSASSATAAAAEPSPVGAILQARVALSRRLCRLEQNLPPRPITVARQLLDMVWMRYDTDMPPSRSHWLDIMAETEFESVFG
ncbi:hypothetical protein F503_06776 [Ophiostoma piceae UAMH 11346]|uniref:Zn(2)-C6 fungal-type domain-containing protein n=1 Tax=Ophiostoma piceae (strain UAMH 11346) TaxID=1262450 RepID=S3C8E4_OPHP1|nr:hypothetical protein F503_06776 [Ophiostoma piceae UAMH 11346]